MFLKSPTREKSRLGIFKGSFSISIFEFSFSEIFAIYIRIKFYDFSEFILFFCRADFLTIFYFKYFIFSLLKNFLHMNISSYYLIKVFYINY